MQLEKYIYFGHGLDLTSFPNFKGLCFPFALAEQSDNSSAIDFASSGESLTITLAFLPTSLWTIRKNTAPLRCPTLINGGFILLHAGICF
jgi:hypothetical protein